MGNNTRYGIIFIIVFLDLLGAGIILPLLPFYAEKFTASAIIITLLVSIYSLMQFIFSPILGHLSDKYGRRPVLIISQVGSAIGYLMLAFANSIHILFLSRIIDGITGGNISTAQAYISDVSTKKDRKKALGIIGAAFGLGFILGPTIGGFLGHINIILPGIFAAIAALTASILVYLKLPESKRHKTIESFQFNQIYSVLFDKKLSKIFLVTIFFGLSTAMMQSTFALYNQKVLGFRERENGLIFAYIGIVSVFMQLYVIRKLEKKYTDDQLVKIGLFVGSLGFLLISLVYFSTYKILLFSLGLTLSGFGMGLFNPTIRAILTKKVKNYGKYLGLLSSYISLTMIIGPIFAGNLFELLKPYSVFISASLLMILSYFVFKIKK
ncbi:MAG: MFS transporter [Candidatus Aenigmarchaeota archaeon]|nr:MFS transporter [Candidatus Aenigmarchaeota archaeon]